MGSSLECLYLPASLLAPMDELFPKFELDFSLSFTKMPPEAISLDSRSKYGWFDSCKCLTDDSAASVELIFLVNLLGFSRHF